MLLLHGKDLYKNFAGTTILQNINFMVNSKDKIGIIGINGAGKSTLLKMILGLEDHDVDPKNNTLGSIYKKNNLTIGYLAQNSNLNEENTPLEEAMMMYNLKDTYQKLQIFGEYFANQPLNNNENNSLSNSLLANRSEEDIMSEFAHTTTDFSEKDGYAIESKIKYIFEGLGLSPHLWQQAIKTLSGGQKTRLSLAKLIITEPELLILDEPTNHIDLDAIEWLENFLQNYKNAFILISHDTYFLNNTVNSIFEIENKTLKTYKGNYDDYTIQKEIYLSGALKAYQKEQERVTALEEFVRKYKAGVKSKQAMGRKKLLDRIEKSENPVIPIRKMKLKFKISEHSGKVVANLKDLSKSYNNITLFKNLNLEILKGDRIGIIGKNGVGKSTLLKIISQLEKADSGQVNLGSSLNIGYYDQTHKNLTLKNTILEEIIFNFDVTEEKARTIAGSFLFSKDDVLKKISSLSGGEKARVSLIKLLLQNPNFLILDEPTNHLDIYAKEILEEALEGYNGTILLVSHDRHFLESTVNKIFIITSSSNSLFNGSYNEYITQKKATASLNNNKTQATNYKNKQELSPTKEPLVTNEAKLSEAELKKIKNKISNLEKELKSLENNLIEIENKETKLYAMATNENSKNNINDLQNEIDSLYFEGIETKNKIALIKETLSTLKASLP